MQEMNRAEVIQAHREMLDNLEEQDKKAITVIVQSEQIIEAVEAIRVKLKDMDIDPETKDRLWLEQRANFNQARRDILDMKVKRYELELLRQESEYRTQLALDTLDKRDNRK